MRIWHFLTISTSLLLSITIANAGLDTLSQARMAAVQGDHATCAQLADQARRERDAVWHAHHVYATCQIYAVEADRQALSDDEYATGIEKAVDALRFLLNTPGLLVIQEQRASVEFMVKELGKRITNARN
jgi:hypothetical protein